MEVKPVIRYCVASLLAVLSGCDNNHYEPTIEPPLAVAQVGSRTISSTSTSLVFEHDFFIYDEDGLFGEDKFSIPEYKDFFAEDGYITIKVLSLEKVQATPKGCYSVAMVVEQNGMERPDRTEQLARTIFKNTPSCSDFNLSTYPKRNSAASQTGDFEIIGDSFINNSAYYDQNLASIAGNSYELYKKGQGAASNQFKALDAVTEFVVENATHDNKQVFVLYQNVVDRPSSTSDAVRDYAILNGIAINGVKNDYSSDDELFRISHATGGIYFMPADYDPFHPPGKSDYYVMARYADDFLQGNYTFYRARYELTANRDYFYPGMQFYMTSRANRTGTVGIFGDEEQKLIPVYVPIPE